MTGGGKGKDPNPGAAVEMGLDPSPFCPSLRLPRAILRPGMGDPLLVLSALNPGASVLENPLNGTAGWVETAG